MTFKSSENNLIYIDCGGIVDFVQKNIYDLDLQVDNIPKKDLRKLTLHYFLIYIFKKSKNRQDAERPVYFLLMSVLEKQKNDVFLESIVYSYKKLKTLLPVPFVILKSHKIFKEKNGDLKGLNEKMTSYYLNRKVEIIKLKR